MSNINITAAARAFVKNAAALGIDIPDPITAVLDPANDPRLQLAGHLDGTPGVQEAIHAALDAGKDPSTDKTVQKAITVQTVRERAGDLDGVQARRISSVFREQWDTITSNVNAVFAPAAEKFTRAHNVLASKGIDHTDTDLIRRTGGEALTAWADALAAEDTLSKTPRIMTDAYLAGHPAAYGNLARAHWTITPNLDTWVHEEPNLKDLWAILDSGATLALASTRSEAEQRAQLPGRERELARLARVNSSSRGGFGSEATRPITYTGADGQMRVTDSRGTIRNYIEGTTAEMPANMVRL